MEVSLYRLDVCGRIINVVMKGRAVVTVLGARKLDVEKETLERVNYDFEQYGHRFYGTPLLHACGPQVQSIHWQVSLEEGSRERIRDRYRSSCRKED